MDKHRVCAKDEDASKNIWLAMKETYLLDRALLL